MNQNPDPALYRELSVPFPDLNTANQALEAFATDLQNLRRKHRLCDVVCLITVNVMEQGEEVARGTTVQLGDLLRHPLMLAQQLGKMQQRYETKLGKAIQRGEL